jgi:hypothetical protein
VRLIRRLAVPVLVVAWVLFLLWPFAFLVSPATVDPGPGFTELYDAFTQLFGADLGKWLFVGLWITLNALVSWGLFSMLLKRRRRDS